MASGGYRKPPGRSGPGGPGKFSKRTDGNNPARNVPGLSNPDVQYGDVSAMRNALHTAPIPDGGKPARPPLQTQPPAALGPAVQGPLPDFLTQGSSLPDEATTHGLGMGPGAGPEALNDQTAPTDPREAIALFVARAFGNKTAYEMHNRMVQERSQAAAPPPSIGAPSETPPLPDTGFPAPSMPGPGAAPTPEQPTGAAPAVAPPVEAPAEGAPPAGGAPAPTPAPAAPPGPANG